MQGFFSVIVAFAADDHKHIILHVVRQPVRIVDAAAPQARQIMLQRFWFAYAVERVAAGVFDKFIDALDNSLVGL